MTNSRLVDFLTFDYLLTTRIIQWVWLIGVAVIIYFSMMMMTFSVSLPWYLNAFANSPEKTVNSLAGISGLIFLIIGNLFWRILCETFYATCSIRSGVSMNSTNDHVLKDMKN